MCDQILLNARKVHAKFEVHRATSSRNIPKNVFFTTFLALLPRPFTRWRNENINKLIKHGTWFRLSTFRKSNQISILTTRSADMAILKMALFDQFWHFFPNFGRTRFFLNMRFAPKSGHFWLPIAYRKSEKSLEPIFHKFRKTTTNGTFSQILGPPNFFSKIRLCQFSSLLTPYLHAKNQRKLTTGSMTTFGLTN